MPIYKSLKRMMPVWRLETVDTSRKRALAAIEKVLAEYSDVLVPPRTGYGPMVLNVMRGAKDELTERERTPWSSGQNR